MTNINPKEIISLGLGEFMTEEDKSLLKDLNYEMGVKATLRSKLITSIEPVSKKIRFQNPTTTNFEGIVIIYNPGINLFEEFFYENGVKQRHYRAFKVVPGGKDKVMRKGSIKDGKYHGKFTFYDENGNIEHIEYYKDGVVDGLVEHYDVKNKSVNRIQFFINNIKNGPDVNLDSGVVTHLVNYRNGLKHGPEYVREDGKLVQKEMYKNGKSKKYWYLF